MKTYKFLLVALIATGVFSACTNDDGVPAAVKVGSEISFRLQGGTPEVTTRALATTINNLEAFVVFGTDNVLASSGLLFNGMTVARQFGGTTFAYAPKAYYSAAATSAGFYAFSPVSAKLTGAVTIPSTILTTGISFGYTVPVPDNTGDAVQEDLLVAGTAVPTAALISSVSLNFKHALSRIFVTATNTTADPVIIKELTLKNLLTTGTITVGPASAISWAPTTPRDDYAYILAPSGVVVPGGTLTKAYVTSMEQGMMVLPQPTVNTSSANDFSLEILYDFANLTNQTQSIKLTNGYSFTAGQQYTININFAGGLQPIEFTITVDPFNPLINELP